MISQEHRGVDESHGITLDAVCKHTDFQLRNFGFSGGGAQGTSDDDMAGLDLQACADDRRRRTSKRRRLCPTFNLSRRQSGVIWARGGDVNRRPPDARRECSF